MWVERVHRESAASSSSRESTSETQQNNLQFFLVAGLYLPYFICHIRIFLSRGDELLNKWFQSFGMSLPGLRTFVRAVTKIGGKRSTGGLANLTPCLGIKIREFHGQQRYGKEFGREARVKVPRMSDGRPIFPHPVKASNQSGRHLCHPALSTFRERRLRKQFPRLFSSEYFDLGRLFRDWRVEIALHFST